MSPQKTKCVGERNGKCRCSQRIFWAEGVGKLHGRGGDKDLVALGEPLDDALAIRHDVEIFEEVVFLKIGHQPVLAAGGEHIHHPVAPHILNGELFVELGVVAADELAQGVGEHLVHVDRNTLHAVCALGAPLPAGLDLRLAAVVHVEDASAAFALLGLSVAQADSTTADEVPIWQPVQRWSRARASAVPLRGGDAVVFFEAVFVDLGTKRGALLLPLLEVGLLQQRAARRGCLFGFEISRVGGMLLTGGEQFPLDDVGALHAFELAIFDTANLLLRKSDLVFERGGLRLVLHDVELLAGFDDLCLLILQVAFVAPAAGLFIALPLLEGADGLGVSGELTLDTADAARRRLERSAELADLSVELLQANQVLEGLVHHNAWSLNHFGQRHMAAVQGSGTAQWRYPAAASLLQLAPALRTRTGIFG